MGKSRRDVQVSFRTTRTIRRLIDRLIDEAKYDFEINDSKFNLQDLGNAMVLYLASLTTENRRALLEEGMRMLDAQADRPSDNRSVMPGTGTETTELDNPESLKHAPKPPRTNKGGA